VQLFLNFIDFLNLQYFIQKLQHNANIPQGSHFLFKFSIRVVQINKINLVLTSNLTLTLSSNFKPYPNPNLKLSRKKREKTTKKHHCESAEVCHIA